MRGGDRVRCGRRSLDDDVPVPAGRVDGSVNPRKLERLDRRSDERVHGSTGVGYRPEQPVDRLFSRMPELPCGPLRPTIGEFYLGQ